MSRAQLRKARHVRAREMMVQGQLEEALGFFEGTINELGPHVGLLSDYAACFYELGRFEECWDAVDRLRNEFIKVIQLLSEDSKKRTLLSLGKFHEEMAEPVAALAYYDEALLLCSSLEEKKWIYANQLRLLAFYGRASDLQKKYRAVTELFDVEDNLKIEILHGLMWADWGLFGYEQAQQRWKSLQKLDLNNMDVRLMARDFLEISILAGRIDNEDCRRARGILLEGEPLDYDRALLVVLSSDDSEELDELRLSIMMKIRLTLFKLGLCSGFEQQMEYKRKYSYLIGSLSSEAQEAFRSIEPTTASRGRFTIFIDDALRQVSLTGTRSVRLTNLQMKFLVLFLQTRKLSLDEVALALWESDGDESMYHRLRMLVYKINELLRPVLGLNPFEVRKRELL